MSRVVGEGFWSDLFYFGHFEGVEVWFPRMFGGVVFMLGDVCMTDLRVEVDRCQLDRDRRD